MDTAQLIAVILSSSVIGGVLAKLLDWAKEAQTGRAKAKRAEVDRALAERDRALAELETVEAADQSKARHVRIVEESLAVHRRVIIDAPCLGPEALPSYPSWKE